MQGQNRRDCCQTPASHRLIFSAIILTVWCLLPGYTAAATWNLDLFLGTALNFNSNLKITQRGEEDLEFTARWRTDAFQQPVYWVLRTAYWTSATRGWALDLCHNKLVLDDPPSEVNAYSHTHGYNLLTIQRLWVIDGNLVLLAAGVVVSHPESTIRGLRFPETGGDLGGGYHLAGPVVGAGLGRRFSLTGPLQAVLEGRFTLSHATTPVANGESSFTSASFHFLVGLSLGF